MIKIDYPNKYGIFASSVEFTKEEFDNLCNGPIAAAQELLEIDLQRVDRESMLTPE